MVDNCILRHDTEFSGIGLDHFELDSTHPTANQKGIILANWPVGFQEVGLKVNIRKVLDRIKMQTFR